MKSTLILLAAAFALGGCATGAGNSSSGGALLGSFASSGSASKSGGGLAAMGNGLLGGSVGANLDPGDRRLALEAEYQALEYTLAGRSVSWRGTSDTSSGEVIVYQPYRVGSQDCRQYMHTVTTGSQSNTARGTACRNDDGTWTPLT